LEQQVSRSRRYGNPLSVIVIEITGAGADEAGAAPTTDPVRLAVGQFLRDQLRWVDFIGRGPDDRFTLVLPETPEPHATRLADKLRQRLADLALPESDTRIKVEARLAVAGWTKGDDAGRLLRRVGEGLGRVKTEEII
jgi:GGDEF domain-containing protein